MPNIAWFAYPPERRHQRKGQKTSKLKVKQKKAHESLLTLRKLGLGGGVDPEEERDPPPKPTQVTFPADVQLNHSHWDANTPPPQLFNLFSKIRQPSDLNAAHVEALNIIVDRERSFEDLVPLAEDGKSFLPSVDSRQLKDTAGNADAAASRKQGDFTKRYAELQYDNHKAFGVINRTLKGSDAPRVAFLRRFWEGLEDMSRYWDCSMDHYFESEAPEDEHKRAKRQRRESTTQSEALENGHEADTQALSSYEYRDSTERSDGSHESMNSLPESSQPHSTNPITSATRAELDSTSERAADDSQKNATPPRTRMRYKGCRTSTGRDMPDSSRSSTVHGFMEAVAWPFSFSISPPKVPPRLQLGNLVLPVRQHAAVYRVPGDRTRGRKGFVEGPVIGIQTRPETNFGQDVPEETLATARLDLLREVAVLLQIAQERHREGKVAEKPGEGKWWTSKPRWGSGPGNDGHIYSDELDSVGAAEKTTTQERSVKKNLYSSKASKRTPIEVWEEIKCGTSLWDPKTEYTKIGKDPQSEYDQIFLVSSINHHISVLKLTVHPVYLDFLATQRIPNTLPDDVEWCTPKLQRSRWFDLFVREDRSEVFRGLWGVMAYLARDSPLSTGL